VHPAAVFLPSCCLAASTAAAPEADAYACHPMNVQLCRHYGRTSMHAHNYLYRRYVHIASANSHQGDALAQCNLHQSNNTKSSSFEHGAYENDSPAYHIFALTNVSSKPSSQLYYMQL